MRGAQVDLPRRGARVVDGHARGHHLAQAARVDVLLDRQEFSPDPLRVADVEFRAAFGLGLHDPVRIGQRERDGLLHQDGLSDFERHADGLGVLALGRGDDEGVHLGVFDDLAVIRSMKGSLVLLGHGARAFGVDVRYREKIHHRRGRRQMRA